MPSSASDGLNHQGHQGASRRPIIKIVRDHPRALRAFVSLVVPLRPLPAWVPAFAGMSGSEGLKDLVFLRRQNLAAAVGAGLQVDVVRALQLAGVGVFHIAVRPQRMVRAAHATTGGGDFSLGDGHGTLRGLGIGSRRLCRKSEGITRARCAVAAHSPVSSIQA
jgi:hypothetical protein